MEPAPQQPSRTLRVRMTLSYALFFTILLTLLAVILRQFLAQTLDTNVRHAIDQDFATLKGYLRIEKGVEHWYVDQGDADEVALEVRLHRVLMVADAHGNILDMSDAYRSLDPDSKEQIRRVVSDRQVLWQEKVDDKGEHYLIRVGVDNDEILEHTNYYVAIGRSLKDNRALLRQFTWLCVGLIPLIAFGGCVLGWVYSGRALLTPVMEIVRTAERISGSNLSMRIPTRKSGDELDYLIETFNGMISRLEESFTQIRQFSTDVSHELRTPITVVRGQLEVALFTANSIEDYREAIVDSLHDIERLSAIVRALLLLSQAETGQVVLQPADINLPAMVAELVEEFQIPAEGAQVKLSGSNSMHDPHAELDRVQVERMISNLLSNALKFTPPGGEVHVETRDSERQVEIEIRDTGRGISAEHLPHIFDRFYRISGPSSDSTPEKGLGLGLSFVAWIVKAHNGHIDVQSVPGKGTTFLIRLPRVVKAVSPSVESAEARNPVNQV